jgi:hypothetical protein
MQTLSIWTPDSSLPTSGKFAVKQRDVIFDLSGKSYINIHGLDFFAGRLKTDAKSERITLDNIHANYVSQFNYFTSQSASLAGKNSGFVIDGKNHLIQNSVFNYSAGNLLVLIGQGHIVKNSSFNTANYVGISTAPIKIYGANITVQNNTIRGAGTNGIHIQGNGVKPGGNINNKILLNDISQFGYLARDLGGLYACCNSSGDYSGSTIQYNWFHDAVDPYNSHADKTLSKSQKGIYLDSGTDSFIIHHNVVWNTNTGFRYNDEPNPNLPPPINNRFYNNTVWNIDTQSVAGGGEESAKEVLFINNIFGRLPNAKGIYTSNIQPPIDPTFVSAGPNIFDFHLRSISPAINKGQEIAGITDGFTGTAPDIGAYELQGLDWNPGCALPECKLSK